MNTKEFLIDQVKVAYKIARVWKKTADIFIPNLQDQREYVAGWNDCIAEQIKNEKKYLKHLESIPYEEES